MTSKLPVNICLSTLSSPNMVEPLLNIVFEPVTPTSSLSVVSFPFNVIVGTLTFSLTIILPVCETKLVELLINPSPKNRLPAFTTSELVIFSN